MVLSHSLNKSCGSQFFVRISLKDILIQQIELAADYKNKSLCLRINCSYKKKTDQFHAFFQNIKKLLPSMF
jgi:hypothetical protein